MPEATSTAFAVRVRLAPAGMGGRATPITSGYRPMVWLGETARGRRHLHSALLELRDAEEIPPGGEGDARLTPMYPEHWRDVRPGAELAFHEGRHEIGTGTVSEAPSRATLGDAPRRT